MFLLTKIFTTEFFSLKNKYNGGMSEEHRDNEVESCRDRFRKFIKGEI